MKKFTDVASMNAQELKKKKTTLTETLFEYKIKNQMGQLASPIEIRKVRKEIAQINTALSAKTAAEVRK